MLCHWLVIGLAAFALARPETYKENEEFNYARSSTDEGSKSGYYEAQRGNVGGNYERAHNMDTIAQGQMSDAINQVGATVDEVAKSNHGNLRSQAYSSGIYGQRPIDTRNLAGRNFHENSHGSSSIDQSSRYQQDYGSRGNLYDCNDCTYTSPVSAGYNSAGYGASHSSYQEASSHHSSSVYGQSNLNSDAGRYKIIPVKIVARPNTPVNIGVQAGIAEHTADSAFGKENIYHSHNSLAHNEDRVFVAPPSSGLSHEKHYESSYKKEWEKHSEVTPIPLMIPVPNVDTVDIYNSNYRQNQYRQQNNHASDIETLNTNAFQNHRAGVHENSYESAHRSGYQRVAEPVNNRYVVLSATPDFVAVSNKQDAQTSQHASSYMSGSRSQSQSAYRDQSAAQGHLSTNNDNLLAQHNHDALVALTGKTNDATLPEPKAYESSYSYHKSWERQGDPYIIQPASSAYKNSRYTQDDCDDEQQHQRHVRSAGYGSYTTEDSLEDFGQQAEELIQPSEDLGQQIEDLGQQTEEFGQKTEFGQYSKHFGHESQGFRQHPGDKWQYVVSQRTPVATNQYRGTGSKLQRDEQRADYSQQTRNQAGIESQIKQHY